MLQDPETSTLAQKALIAHASIPAQVVVIGASAGGIEALKAFFKSPTDFETSALIVVLHSLAGTESRLKTLLEQHAHLNVELAENGMELRANSLYIVPPAMFLKLKGRTIRLHNRGELDPHNLPIDYCFRSVAETYKSKATGIILSGAGGDGSKGLKAIADHGGLCLVQSHKSAQHISMPSSAGKLTKAVVLEPDEMPQYIKQHIKSHTASSETTLEAEEIQKSDDEIRAIFGLLAQNYQVDLSYYQSNTLKRRLAYRLEQLKMNATEYYQRLSLDEKEVALLLEHMLVVVTEFFRDAKAFESLVDKVVTPLMDSDESLRIWVAGCATGQEAYSLAIALSEAFVKAGKSANFKIFATDLNDAALKVASRGQYSKASLSTFPEELLNSYFEDVGEVYQVAQVLRNKVSFAKHNVYSDPPFTKMHLISCRNLLIYFKDEARKRILSRFHFSLSPAGYMFLGASENLDTLEANFKTLDSKWKLFQKQESDHPIDPQILVSLSGKHSTKYPPRKPRSDKEERLELLKNIAQEGLLLSKDFELVETFGNAHKLLSFPEGRAELNIFALLSGALLQSVRINLHQTARTKKSCSSLSRANEQQTYEITTTCIELNEPEQSYYFLKIQEQNNQLPLEQQKENTNRFRAQDDLALLRVEELELMLERKDEQLQTAIEELETTNEELMASNEELMASNEELQSVNEELNSVNEELHTVNVEYQSKLHAVTQANNDLINLQNVAQIGTVFVDRNMRIRSYSPLLAKRFNFMMQDIGRPVEHLIHSLNTDLHLFRNALKEAVESGTANEFEANDLEGVPYWVRLMPYMTSEGVCEGAVLSLTEIKQLKQAQKNLEENHRFSENLIAATPGINYIYVIGQGRRTFAGNDFPKTLGYPNNDESSNPKFLVSIMHPEDQKRLPEHNERLNISKKGEVVHFEFRVKHANGYWVWMETRETVHKRTEDNSIQEILGIALDISSRKRIEERLQHDAFHDALTGLRNRMAFVEHLSQVHKDFLRYPDQNYAVLFIDLDRFKAINDTFGHAKGDHVLKVTAQRLEACLREVDIVARHSGDEFLVLLKNISSSHDAELMATRIMSEIEKPILQGELRFEVSASIGIALANPEQNSSEFLINSADKAMYKSKESQSKKIHIFDDSLHLVTLKQASMEQDLRLALRENQLAVHYQPIIDLKSGKIVALEALARWPFGANFISPDQFIPLAEATHLIGKIDKAIFDQACQFLKTQARPDLQIHLNLSASQLNNASTLEYLLNPNVNPKQICLEITESQLVLKNLKSVHLLEKLRDFGYHIAIDDFGTGYSSLAYLQSLPATTLKIDQSFVQSIETNQKSQSIIAAIIHLAKALGYSVVAEGIENDVQLDFVKSLACDFAQGYLFSKPLPPEACIKLMHPSKKDEEPLLLN